MTKKNQILIFIVFVGILIAYHAFGYIGHYGYDDLHYAKLANDFNNGIINYNDHFSFRTPLIILTSLSYSLFGISDFASSLPAIFISVLILLTIFSILKEKGNKTLIIGLALTTLSNWFIFYSDKLMPDIYVVFAVIGAVYFIHQYRYKNRNNSVILYSILLNLSLLFGFMSKGTIILILPLLLYYFAVDILQKKNMKFWIITIVIGLVIFSTYFFIIKLITGDILKRFEAIASNSYLSLCSYDKQSILLLLKRILYEFFKLIIFQGMAVGFIFVFAYLIEKKSLSCFRLDDSFSFWITSSIILLLSSNLMTISLTSYSPMCLDPRHYLFLIPVISIPASIIINGFIEIKENKNLIIAISALVAVISFFLQGNSFMHLYLPLFVIVLAYIFIRISRLSQYIFTATLIIVFSIKPFTMINYAQKIKYGKQKEIFSEEVLESKDSITVITNDVQKRLGNYYNRFNNNDLFSIVNYNDFKYDSSDCRKKILFLNGYSRYLSNMDAHDLPYYAKNILKDNKLLFQDKELNIAVYEMTNFSTPEKSSHLLFSSLNDFEGTTQYWNQNEFNISNEIYYEGKSSIQAIEYSSTFEYPIDSLPLGDLNQLFISCNAYCNFNDKTNSKLVISIEDSNGAYIWEGIEINKYLKAFSNWWPIKHEINIDVNGLKEKSKIKVYIWNIDKKEAYIDNFKVELFGQ
jgi:4-amino-4-deoxy-L-arabinose transferase-like glycosyltransferase